MLSLHHFSNGAPSEVEIFALAESSAATCAAGEGFDIYRRSQSICLGSCACMRLSIHGSCVRPVHSC